MILAVDHAYWMTLLLSVCAAAFTVRLFIIQHDCGHHSFFLSRRLNDFIGTLIGLVTLTPHEYWRRSHNIHHATCGNLEKRGFGDISVLTVAEYTALPLWRRIAYRIYRNPVAILVVGPIYIFVIKYRLPLDLIRRQPRLLISVMATNLGIAAILTGLGFSFGFIDVLMVQAPIVLLSCAAGIWLFYVQHQFEDTYWRKEGDWDFHEASIKASSYYDLPQPLRWFSGNIGLHHIHHLSCRIPNYRLGACLRDIPALQNFNRIGLRDSLSTLRLTLWDETAQRLIPFKTLRRARGADRLPLESERGLYSASENGAPLQGNRDREDSRSRLRIGSFVKRGFRSMNKAKILIVAGLMMSFSFAIAACSPEVGSKEWCEDIKKKPKGDLTANEAKDFAKHCVLK